MQFVALMCIYMVGGWLISPDMSGILGGGFIGATAHISDMFMEARCIETMRWKVNRLRVEVRALEDRVQELEGKRR